jgi:beta-lactamase class A
MNVAERIDAELESGDLRGFVHAAAIDGYGEVGLRAEDSVCLASVLKVAVLAELFRRIGEGSLDPQRRILVPASRRTFGPTGISMMHDDVEVSLRDLAFLMMHVSDNTASDVIQELLTTEAVNDNLEKLGLKQTILIGDCKFILDQQREDTGLSVEELEAGRLPNPATLRHFRSLTPQCTSRSTAHEMTRLLTAIWTDRAASPAACAEMRAIMKAQVWPHRLRSGFGDGIRVAGKTGTLAGIRNEVGVIEYPDGGRFAVAVFTRSIPVFEADPALLPVQHDPTADALIGRVARLAVEEIRARLAVT